MHMANQSELKKLAIQYFSGGLPTEKEKILFDFIIESPENLSQFREWEKVWITAAQDDENVNADWENFLEKKNPFAKSEKVQKYLSFSLWKQIAAVAAILVVAVLSTIYVQRLFGDSQKSNYVSVEAPYGEKSKITLADGSVVWLNSGSKLTYAEINKKHEQIVELSGEGYFEIAKNKDRKFIVKTNIYDIEVVGTKFNITAYEDDRYVTTTLLEGKVNLHHRNKKTGLNPGESIAYDTTTGQLQKPNEALQNSNAWIHNAIIYDNITLNDLTAKLSRQYNVAIKLESDELAGTKFNIALRNDESIRDVMNAIEKILNVEVSNVGLNYYIGKKSIN